VGVSGRHEAPINLPSEKKLSATYFCAGGSESNIILDYDYEIMNMNAKGGRKKDNQNSFLIS